jgi:hypothetical protein
MARVIGAFLLLMGLVWLAGELPIKTNSEKPPTVSWRRTCEGWERTDRLDGNVVPEQLSVLHPAVVGTVLLFLALTAAVALSPDDN